MKFKVIASGCYWRVDGAMKELAIGEEFEAGSFPVAFVGRVEEIKGYQREFEVNTPASDKRREK